VRSRVFRLGGFTLIELLVVIAIIGILAALLFPVFSLIRWKARLTKCKNNLHQFSLGVMTYQNDYDESYPPWLSTIYPAYIQASAMYLCPNDDKRGEEGGMPEWFSGPDYLASQFPETDDTKARDDELAGLSGEFFDHERDVKLARN